MKGEKSAKSVKIVGLLNQALRLEYSSIIHLPRIASSVTDEKVREMVLILENTSLKHADIVARTISALGGNPDWAFESAPIGENIVEIFQKQLDKEKLALQLHLDSASLIQDRNLKLTFAQLARDHESHIQIINKILERLSLR